MNDLEQYECDCLRAEAASGEYDYINTPEEQRCEDWWTQQIEFIKRSRINEYLIQYCMTLTPRQSGAIHLDHDDIIPF